MIRKILIASIILAGVGWTVQAVMTFEVRRPGEPIYWNREPQQVQDLADMPGRVLAAITDWSGGYTYRTVYFRGDAAAVNRQLELIASVSGMPLMKALPRVLIHDDDPPKRVNDLYPVDVPEFNWSLHIDSHVQIGGPEQGKLDISVFAEIWVSDRITLDELKIPQGLRVKAISRTQQFADQHETKRLGGKQAMLEQRIRDLQDELAMEKLRQRRLAATQPAQTQERSSSMPATGTTP